MTRARLLIPVRRFDPPSPQTHRSSALLHGLSDNGVAYRFGGGEIVCDRMHVVLVLAPRGSGRRSWERCTHIAAMLAFIHDLPIVPQLEASELRAQRSGFDLGKYLELLRATSEACSEFYAHGFFPLQDCAAYRVVEPAHPATWRAVLAYWAALLSPALPTRMVNFFRCVEALGHGNMLQQEQLLKDLPNETLRPIWAGRWSADLRRTNSAGEPLRADRARRLKTRALKHLSSLLAVHGSEQRVREHLWRTRRGKAAHADVATAEFDQLTEIREHAADVDLMRFAARVAIERAWP